MRMVVALAALFTSIIVCPITSAAPPASQPNGSSSVLSGKAAWDAVLWKYYCKHEYELDVPDEPQAFPEQDELKRLNGEFARRLRAVIAVYQAASKLNNLGPAPGDGGIRSAADQLKIYQRGRKLKDGAAGDKPQDYDVVGDVDTKAWVSWHELGLACDLREFVGNKVKQPQNTPMTKAFWSETTRAMGELGMIWGGYWPWDYGHVEWHPYLVSPDHVGTPGKAATDADMKYGYDWKIPQDIFIWHGKGEDPSASAQDLNVFHLVQKENWLCLAKHRFIERQGEKYRRGAWTTYEPPVRVIPLYNPVTHLDLNSRDDSQWNADTSVTLDGFQEQTRDGKKTTESTHVTGKVHLASEIRIHDWQKTAIVSQEVSGYPPPKPDPALKQANLQAYKVAMAAYEQAETQRLQRRADGMKRFAHVLKAATYDVEIKLEVSRDASKESIHSTGRRLNRDQYTEDWDNTADSQGPAGPVYLAFSWDRDNGTIGLHGLDALIDHDHPALEVRGAQCLDSGQCTLVATKAPHGIEDMEQAPDWPAANPKPPPKSEKLPKGQFLRP